MDRGADTHAPRHDTIDVGGVPVATASYESTISAVLAWAAAGESRYVCACSAHGVITAQDDPTTAEALSGADLVVPDGMPLVWVMRWKGRRPQPRVRGTTLFGEICEAAAQAGVPVFLLGSTEATLAELELRLPVRYPGLQIAGCHAPPFRPPTEAEAHEDIERIRASGARIVLVGLGTPKQDRWMARHRGRISAVMVGLGAAFDYYAGNLPATPMWMRRAGLEWLFRLACEPRRLWGRYAIVVPRFLLVMGRALLQPAPGMAERPRGGSPGDGPAGR